MKKYKKDLLKPYWDKNLDYLPLGAKWRGKYQKRTVKRLIQEIDERALDIEVAEKVFGYKVEIIEKWNFETEDYNEGSGDYKIPYLVFKVTHYETEDKIGYDYLERKWEEEIELPHYSTVLKDAWKIVEHITQDEDNDFIINPCKFHNDCEIELKFIDKDGILCGPLYILDKTPELAICKAALKVPIYAK